MSNSLRTLTLLVCMAAVLGGCSMSSNKVAFTNVSDTWVNVRFYIANPDAPEGGQQGEFTSDTRLQIKPGDSGSYSLASHQNYIAKGRSIVHVQVEPVGPSWQASGTEYWLELLTPPPVSIIATGPGESMTFNSSNGAVAVIPQPELESGRFDHKMVTVPEDENAN